MADENSTLNVIAVGASAGGVEALTTFAAGLAPDLPYAILVVLHMPADAPSVLARILDRSGPLRAVTAAHGARLAHGTIHVAAPNRHLLLHDGQIVLSEGPTENGHRPAINALFRSVALAHAHRAVGVLLSGVLDDGVLGSAAIRSRSGTTIAQSPTDALFPAMPQNAINAGVIDHQVPAAEMGGLLKQLAARVFEEHDMEPDARMELENRIAMARRFSTEFNAEALGSPSGYTCPDCNGSLVTVSDGNYRCHVGHAWTADALLRARDDEVEDALWIALRSLQEKAKLSRRLADEVPPGMLSERYHALADEAEHAMSVLGRRLATAYRKQRRD
ncbi:Chemotaxis response regulator protein-glutamate methylesterase [Mycobacterium talmoniae]|uniref:protein-glutamate methylesterase n=1 Tax=Mycobacterium talmoniae TaxID=1858794 RepID=A0A2S8BJ17_9MYCO|nr:chemotaxis protein CheB [Mycobacterium eburneum]PQM46681.1 Chemotaxis response regulator protein-glutamate methylesterase [Mycobacterium talmoniae]TDH49758.1 chemotaxis protein CheB [Mycobacterium eburneum]